MTTFKCLLLSMMICGVAAATAARGNFHVDELRARLDYSEQRLADAEYELANAVADRDAQTGARDDAVKNLDAANAARVDAMPALNETAATARGMSDSLAAMSVRIEVLRKEVAAAEEKFDASAKIAGDLRQSAVKQFEAGAPHQDVVATIKQAETRLDRLYGILDSTTMIGDWFVALPKLPAEPIIQRALKDHDGAVDRLKALRQEFETRMKRDPQFVTSDAQVKADADLLNPLAAEFRGLETQQADLTKRLDEANRALAEKQASIDQFQRDIDRWQQTVTASEAALALAEQRVLAASTEAANARQARDLAYGDWQYAADRQAVVIVPDYQQSYYYNYGYSYYYDGYYPRCYGNGHEGHGHNHDRDDHDRGDGRWDDDRGDADEDDGSRIIRQRDESFRDGNGDDRRNRDDRPQRTRQHRADAPAEPPPDRNRPTRHPVDDDDRPPRLDTNRGERFRSSDSGNYSTVEDSNRRQEERQRADRKEQDRADRQQQAERQRDAVRREDRQRDEQQRAHRQESRRDDSRSREDRGKRYQRD